MTWDPFGTLAKALWIGGGQWAGKSTVANILAERHGLTAYHYDFHMARGHWDRRVAAATRAGTAVAQPTAEDMYVTMTVAESVAHALEALDETFEYTLDDLRALVSGRPVLVEGWVARPDKVVPIVGSPGRMIVMVPSDAWRVHQSLHLERAMRPHGEVSDLAVAQRNRLERDRLVAASAVAQAYALGVRVLEVDGSLGVERVADIVSEHFAPHW